MYDLNQSIKNWSSAISQNGTCSTDEMQELEAHLREQVADLVDVGLSEQEAFSVGVSRIGKPGEVCGEYEKVSPMRLWRRRLFILLWAAPAIGTGCFAAILLLPKAQAIWQSADTSGAPAWPLATSRLIFELVVHYGVYILIAAVAAMILFDSRAKSWSRHRHLPVSVLAFSANAAVLIALTCLCILFAIIVPAAMAR